MAKKATGVGYGRPPVHSRFKPGQSGNEKGRPKKALSFSDIILDELSQVQTIEKDGEQIRVTALRIMAKQMIRSAAKGNVRAIQMIIELFEEGVARRAKAEQDAIRARQPRPDLSKMTNDERTALYFETLRRADGH